ncbi:hypothetical protein KY363_04000 [Candidatus Woesearchaeota archaeon]|nr:hypothetical protein [Candidatus Woesearchaeota archaeon]
MEKIYSALKAKHGLPEYSVLDSEFEVSSIEEKSFPLRNIRKKMTEKIEFSLKLLDEMIHPESGFASYHESGMLSPDERERIFVIVRKLMYYDRLSTELFFEDSDELNAAFIKAFMKEWPKLRSGILVFVRKLKDSWQKDVEKKEIVGYLG